VNSAILAIFDRNGTARVSREIPSVETLSPSLGNTGASIRWRSGAKSHNDVMSARQEPSEVIPYAGICAGAVRKDGPYRDPPSKILGRSNPLLQCELALTLSLVEAAWNAHGEQ
jgi:hypothetical protein